MKTIPGPEKPEKEKETPPLKLPPEHPTIKPEPFPTPEKEEPFHPVPETPVIPEPGTYPGSFVD